MNLAVFLGPDGGRPTQHGDDLELLHAGFDPIPVGERQPAGELSAGRDEALRDGDRAMDAVRVDTLQLLDAAGLRVELALQTQRLRFSSWRTRRSSTTAAAGTARPIAARRTSSPDKRGAEACA